MSDGVKDCVKAAFNSSKQLFKNNSNYDAWCILITELVEAGVVDELTVEQCQRIIEVEVEGSDPELLPTLPVIKKTSSARRNWSITETKVLLSSYRDREHEFTQIRKKKDAWENVVQDMESANVLESAVTAAQCETKIKSLMRAYKASIDAEKLTGIGASASKCLLFHELDEIFGNRPIISGAPTVAVGVTDLIQSTPKKNDKVLINKLKLYTPNSKKLKASRMELEKFKQEKRDDRFKEKSKLYMEVEMKKQQRHDDKLNIEKRKIELLEKLAGNL